MSQRQSQEKLQFVGKEIYKRITSDLAAGKITAECPKFDPFEEIKRIDCFFEYKNRHLSRSNIIFHARENTAGYISDIYHAKRGNCTIVCGLSHKNEKMKIDEWIKLLHYNNLMENITMMMPSELINDSITAKHLFYLAALTDIFKIYLKTYRQMYLTRDSCDASIAAMPIVWDEIGGKKYIIEKYKNCTQCYIKIEKKSIAQSAILMTILLGLFDCTLYIHAKSYSGITLILTLVDIPEDEFKEAIDGFVGDNTIIYGTPGQCDIFEKMRYSTGTK